MSETLEQCGNCGRVIGKLERSYLLVVCNECHQRLVKTEAEEQASVPVELVRPASVQATTMAFFGMIMVIGGAILLFAIM